MNRRRFLRSAFAASTVVASGIGTRFAPAADQPQIMTATGPIDPEALGFTLPHEHIMVDFIGADKVNADRYDAEEALEVALPYLREIKAQGVQAFCECTPEYIGRDAALCRRLARASGLNILTNTGYYGAANDKFVPEHAYRESADELSRRWIDEWRNGIGETGVRPGFIKIGVDSGALSEIDEKLVRAAARTHLATGLTIASHTGGDGAGTHELEVLREEGVAPGAFIWVHAQNERDLDRHVKAAESGAWIEFDSIGPKSIERHLTLVKNMKKHGLLGRVLLSHDAGWYSAGEPRGGSFRSYTTLIDEFIPALKRAGFSDDEIRRMTVENPRETFSIRVRAL